MSWFREKFIGNGDRYNYGAMCMPTYPCKRQEEKVAVNFYGRDEKIPILLALIMGLQHAFAMVGGLITPPLVIFKFTVCGFGPDACPELQQYAIAAALITSGICSCINVSKFRIPFSERIFAGRVLHVGAGVLSVMGTSFTFLPVFEIAISQMVNDGIDGQTAYGKMLGTSMLCCLLEMFFSMLPVRYIKRLFPPLVTAVTVILIGVALCGTGMKYWAGGVVCAEMVWKDNTNVVTETSLASTPPTAYCTNGSVVLGVGSPEFIGLGFSVMVALVVIELFGSVFMKNCNVIIALLFGYMVAGVSNYQGEGYVQTDNIKNAPPITFLWVYTFPLGLYAPAVIPLLIAYLVTTVETVGDLTAVYEVSGLDTNTEQYTESIQGGLFADALSSILSGLFTSMPNTTFSQNNGVIALTKCASRRAGYACGAWLIFLGIFSKISGVITSIPDAVIGGMTIFLFANVLTSGIALTASLDLHSRRVKFIMALSLAVGVGVTVWPYAFLDQRDSPYTANFWRCENCSETMKGVRNGVSIFLSTGYCIGTVFAMMLNTILPEDAPINYLDDQTTHVKDTDEIDAGGSDETAEKDRATKPGDVGFSPGVEEYAVDEVEADKTKPGDVTFTAGIEEFAVAPEGDEVAVGSVKMERLDV